MAPADKTRPAPGIQSLLRCSCCRRVLSPYRVKGRYIYYQCKNPDRRCGVLVPQPHLVKQLQTVLERIHLTESDFYRLEATVLRDEREKSRNRTTQRRELQVAYERVQREIGDLFTRRSEAVALEIVDVVDQRLEELQERRNALRSQLDSREQGGAGAEALVESFRLIKLLGEAAIAGSMAVREQVLRAIASNYIVDNGTLLPELRSPFRQRVKNPDHPEWWSLGDSNPWPLPCHGSALPTELKPQSESNGAPGRI